MIYLLMAALVLVVTLWLTYPLWQRSSDSRFARSRANVAVYQSRLKELENDTAAGLIAEADYSALQNESALQVVTEAGSADAPVVHSQRHIGAAVLLALALAGLGGWGYWLSGSWRLAGAIAAVPEGNGAPTAPQVSEMVAKLANRLEQNPNDPPGWAMLGRSYFVMQRYVDSAKAYATANEQSQGQNSEWLTDEGEALALSRDRDLLGRPNTLFNAALAIDPTYGKALWYAGMAATQAGDFAAAVRHFEPLSKQQLPEELATVVATRLTEARALANGDAVKSPNVSLAGESTTPSASPAADEVSVAVNIQIDPRLAAKLAPNQVLFVFAKAAGGPPMPLAVQRLTQARLPQTVTLNDSMAMTPSMKLSQYEQWVITARLSATGGAQAVSGDLQGQVQVSKANANKPVTVVIDSVVP